MRIVTYTIRLEIPESADLEAVTSTFEEAFDGFVAATEEEYPEVRVTHKIANS